MNPHALAFWSLSATEMLQQLHATKEGLRALKLDSGSHGLVRIA
jgi:hypothetical protein